MPERTGAVVTAGRGLLLPAVAAVLVVLGLGPVSAAAGTPPPTTTAVAAPGAPSSPPAAEPSPTPGGAGPLTLSLGQVRPAAPGPGDRLTLRGSLSNTGDRTYAAPTLRLRVDGEPLSNRTEVSEIADGATDVRTTIPVPGARTILGGALAPGASAQWELSVPIRDLQLPGNGVYAVAVEARGDGRQLALARTLLPFLPETDRYSPTRVAWLWPLAAAAGRDAHGVFPGGRESLSSQLSAGGRLADLLAAPAATPVNWVLDPGLLAAVAALTGEHEVDTGARVRTVDADPAASAWLSRLRATLTGRGVDVLPYDDPDVAALTHHGSRTRLVDATRVGRAGAERVLGREVATDLAWPPEGLADPATVQALRAAGASSVVLSSESLPPDEPITYTPTGRSRLGAGDAAVDVLVADAGLSDALSGDLTAPGAATLARQRLLADLAMITLERPNDARTVLVAPPRRWAPPPGFAAGLLRDTAATPWVRTVGLDALSALPPAPERRSATPVYPAAAAARELPGDYLDDVGRLGRAAADLTAILTSTEGLAADYDAALFSAVSSARRGDGPADRSRRAYLDDLADTVAADTDKVAIIGRSLVTLSDNKGVIPLTVSNDLAEPVRVRPSVRSDVRTRLQLSAPGLVTVAPGRKETVRVQAEATANGLTRVRTQLLTPSGEPFGEVGQLRVNVTNYGSVGLVLVIAVGGALFGAALVRNLRRFLRARRASAPAPPGADGGASSRSVDETVGT